MGIKVTPVEYHEWEVEGYVVVKIPISTIYWLETAADEVPNAEELKRVVALDVAIGVADADTPGGYLEGFISGDSKVLSYDLEVKDVPGS